MDQAPTRISLKTSTPQKSDAMPAGTVVMMGKDTGSERVLLAMNQHAVATAHMMPDATPGRMALG